MARSRRETRFIMLFKPSVLSLLKMGRSNKLAMSQLINPKSVMKKVKILTNFWRKTLK